MERIMRTETLPEQLTAFFKLYILAILVLLKLEASQIGWLLVAVLVDSFFGVLKSVRLGDSFQYSRFVWGMTKKFSILFIPFLLASVGLFFHINMVYVVQAFIYLIVVNDSISILANIGSIYSAKDYKTVDFIEIGIKTLIEVLTKVGNGIIKWLQKSGDSITRRIHIIIDALSKNETPQDPNQPKP